MDRVTQVLATTNEISLKGDNRPWFEKTLTDNVRRALADLPVARVERPAWRVLVTMSEPVDFSEVARRLATVFGLAAIMPVSYGGRSLEDLREHLGRRLRDMSATSFAVRCIRSDKRFPGTSPDVERELGRFIQQCTGWPVDLRRPGLTVHVLIDENGVFLWTRKIAGPGGLPVGVSGRALCLLSGGIDSPVAAYLTLKRGMRLDFVHFHSMPRTDPASLVKVRELTAVLNRYQPTGRVAMVPLLAVQEEIAARCPAELRVLLYRRFMLRIAERLAGRLGCRALVTGESLGQVASQTIENMGAVEVVTSLPVLRPLIGYDKQEIIEAARRISTYDISIQPHMDCCSLLMPSSPATRSNRRALDRAERALEVPALLAAAVAATEIEGSVGRAAWNDMPIPEGALA